MSSSILPAALYYLTDVQLNTPSYAMSNCMHIRIIEGTCEEYAREMYEIPDDLNVPDYIRPYLTLDYEQIISVHHCNGEWRNFVFRGTQWLFVGEKRPLYSSGLDDYDSDEKLAKALVDEDIEDFMDAIEDGANPDVLMFTSKWVPLDFALTCDMEFVEALLEAGAYVNLMKSLDEKPSYLGLQGSDYETFNYLKNLRDSKELLQRHGDSGKSRESRSSI